YHSAPSLEPLHLHIISCDLASTCLKTKAHLGSFATDFFVDVRDVERLLECGGLAAELDRRAKTEARTQCHRCGAQFTNMP
ncbi:hypothetical protein M885DRAFT_404741, partial [Pelagophyceae sp. CCMP2097]